MKVAVIGLWHLGCVTAACLAKLGHTVMAFDDEVYRIEQLKKGLPPLYEPGLCELIDEGVKRNSLHFTNLPTAIQDFDILWITYDTPVSDSNQADVNGVKNKVKNLFPYFKANACVIISSQLPVGTTREITHSFEEHNKEKQVNFIYSLENLRLGQAIERFLNPDRIIMGIQSEQSKSPILKLLRPLVDKIIWMSIESAEMTKHAINSFLATSIVFINELASLCEYFGADAQAVAQGLKSDYRIGPHAYLSPGGGFSGGTLARDVNYLKQMTERQGLNSNFFQTLLLSNLQHKNWVKRKIIQENIDLKGKKIAILGLAYKPGTDSLRNSSAIDISLWLNAQGSIINAYDPTMKELSPELKKIICLQQTIAHALYEADAIVIGTECKEFLDIQMEHLETSSRVPYLFDISGFLSRKLEGKKYIKYFRLGGRCETAK